jgi:glycosyltransferase involved in cell wall biosynthesis
MSKPNLISVVLPVFNGEKSIKYVIDSLLNQTYRNFEIIVVNDCSTDNTLDILSSIQDERIRIVSLKQNSGIAMALNEGIANADGEFIARADADDYSEPNRFEKQIKFLQDNPTYDLCGTYQKIVGGYRDGFNVTAEKNSEIKTGLLFGTTILHSTVLMRRSALDEFMPEPYELKSYLCEDYELWTKLSLNSLCYNIPEFLCHYYWDKSKTWEANESRLMARLFLIWEKNLSNILIYRPGITTLKVHSVLAGRAEISSSFSFIMFLLHCTSLLIHLTFRKNYSLNFGLRFILRRIISVTLKYFQYSKAYMLYKKIRNK